MDHGESQIDDQVSCIRTFNISDAAAASKWIYGKTDKLIIGVVIPGISVIGVLANSAFLFMLVRLPKMRTNLSVYLTNLALCDILFLAFSNIWYAITLRKTDINLAWPTESAMGCAGAIVTTNLWYFASVGFMTLISLERYFAICQPLLHIHFKGKKRNIRLLMAVWVFSFLITITIVPRYFWYHTICLMWPNTPEFRDRPTTLGLCGTLNTDFNVYEGLLLILVFMVSSFVNGLLYFKILKVLSGREILKSSESVKTRSHVEANRVRNQVALTLIINGILFFICQIPLRIDNVDDTFDYLDVNFSILDSQQEATVTTVGHAFLFLNSVINPFIYVFSCRHYRRGMLEAFGLKSTSSINRNRSLSTRITLKNT